MTIFPSDATSVTHFVHSLNGSFGEKTGTAVMIRGDVVIDAAQQMFRPTDVKSDRFFRQGCLIDFSDRPTKGVCIIWQCPQFFDTADMLKIKRTPGIQQTFNVDGNGFPAVLNGFLNTVAAGITARNIRHNHAIGRVAFVFCPPVI